MIGNLGLHVIKNPAGTYSYVGSIPKVLGMEVPASTSAVMGQRAYRDERGDIVELRFPVFKTEADAREYAAAHGCVVQS
jgi:hypothetical protein